MIKLMLVFLLISTSSFAALEKEYTGYMVKKMGVTKYKGISEDDFPAEINDYKFSSEHQKVIDHCKGIKKTHALVVQTYETYKMVPTSDYNRQQIQSTLDVLKVECVQAPKGLKKRWLKHFGGLVSIFR